MPVKMVWDEIARENREMPSEMEAFLEEIQGVYRKYGLSLAHEDTHGSFYVELMDESNVQWLMTATKNYTRQTDPTTGVLLRPKFCGRGCEARGKSCVNCQFRDYCFDPYNRHAQDRLDEILNT